MDNECTAVDGGLLKPDVVEGTDDEVPYFVEIKRTIPKGSVQPKDFKTKKIFVGGVPTTVSEVQELLLQARESGGNMIDMVGTQVRLAKWPLRKISCYGIISLANSYFYCWLTTTVEIKKVEPKKASNPPPATAFARDSRTRSFGDGIGGYSDSYFGGGDFGPYRTPGLGGRLGGYGGYSGGSELGGGYGGFGGSGLGAYRGESSLGYSILATESLPFNIRTCEGIGLQLAYWILLDLVRLLISVGFFCLLKKAVPTAVLNDHSIITAVPTVTPQSHNNNNTSFLSQFCLLLVGILLMNMESSRSHCAYIFTVQQESVRDNRILQVETGKLILLGLAGSEQIEKTGKQLCDNSLFAMTVMLPLITRFNMNMVTSILPMVQLLSPTSMASLHGYIFRYRGSMGYVPRIDAPDPKTGKSTYSLIREPGEVVKIKYIDVPLLYYTEILSMPEIIRLIMATVGRGGHGDLRQRIRDEILLIQGLSCSFCLCRAMMAERGPISRRNQRRTICIPSLIPSLIPLLIRNGIRDGIHKFIISVSDSVSNQQRNQRRNALTNVPFRNKFHFCSVSVPFLISVSKSVSNQKRIFSVSIPSLIRNGIHFPFLIVSATTFSETERIPSLFRF
ncbi:hypothetical protein Syun_012552 [Stephania yunnanensis]|uniref:Kinesin motor domain-containing protein n=1 Tax=Stephania yunnanensis TaxID=152371 RepID=A0AAP0PGH6_9MAGN